MREKGRGRGVYGTPKVYQDPSVVSNIFLIASPIQTFLQQDMILLGTCPRWGSVPVQIRHGC